MMILKINYKASLDKTLDIDLKYVIIKLMKREHGSKTNLNTLIEI